MIKDDETEIGMLREEVHDRFEQVLKLTRELWRSQEERSWLSRDVALLSEHLDALELSVDLLEETNRELRHSVQCLKAQVQVCH